MATRKHRPATDQPDAGQHQPAAGDEGRLDEWMKSFVAAIDAGKLSRAASEAHRSQSAVSMRLKKLETATGCQLLVRGPRQLQLTHEGQTLLGYARRMLDPHAEARAACRLRLSPLW